MRHVQNRFLPVVEDEMNGVCLNTRAATVISSNGYYGYQSITGKKVPDSNDRSETMETQPNCDDNIRFNNMIEIEPDCPSQRFQCRGGGPGNRKRGWEYGAELRDFKRRREGDDVLSSDEKKITKMDRNDGLLEELLLKTHGCNFHHWNGHEL